MTLTLTLDQGQTHIALTNHCPLPSTQVSFKWATKVWTDGRWDARTFGHQDRLYNVISGRWPKNSRFPNSTSQDLHRTAVFCWEVNHQLSTRAGDVFDWQSVPVPCPISVGFWIRIHFILLWTPQNKQKYWKSERILLNKISDESSPPLLVPIHKVSLK